MKKRRVSRGVLSGLLSYLAAEEEQQSAAKELSDQSVSTLLQQCATREEAVFAARAIRAAGVGQRIDDTVISCAPNLTADLIAVLGDVVDAKALVCGRSEALSSRLCEESFASLSNDAARAFWASALRHEGANVALVEAFVAYCFGDCSRLSLVTDHMLDRCVHRPALVQSLAALCVERPVEARTALGKMLSAVDEKLLSPCFDESLLTRDVASVCGACQVMALFVDRFPSWLARRVSAKVADCATLCSGLEKFVLQQQNTQNAPQILTGVKTSLNAWYREEFVTGPSVDSLQELLQRTLNKLGPVSDVDQEIEAALSQFEKNGLVIPAALLTRSSKHPSWFRYVFYTALLKPHPRKREYFSNEAVSAMDTRDRLILALLASRQLQLSLKQYETYVHDCIALGSGGSSMSLEKNAATTSAGPGADVSHIASLLLANNGTDAGAQAQALQAAKMLAESLHEDLVQRLLEVVCEGHDKVALIAGCAKVLMASEKLFSVAAGALDYAFHEAHAEFQAEHLEGIAALLAEWMGSRAARVEAILLNFDLSNVSAWVACARVLLFFLRECGRRLVEAPEACWRVLAFLHLRFLFLHELEGQEGLAAFEASTRKALEASQGRVSLNLSVWIALESQHPLRRHAASVEYFKFMLTQLVAKYAQDLSFAEVAGALQQSIGLKNVPESFFLALREFGTSILLRNTASGGKSFLSQLLQASNTNDKRSVAFVLQAFIPFQATLQGADTDQLRVALSQHCRCRTDWLESPLLLRISWQSLTANIANPKTFEQVFRQVPFMLHAGVRYFSVVRSTTNPASEAAVQWISSVKTAVGLLFSLKSSVALTKFTDIPWAYHIGLSVFDEALCLFGEAPEKLQDVLSSLQLFGQLRADGMSVSLMQCAFVDACLRVLEGSNDAQVVLGFSRRLTEGQLYTFCKFAVDAVVNAVPSALLVYFARDMFASQLPTLNQRPQLMSALRQSQESVFPKGFSDLSFVSFLRLLLGGALRNFRFAEADDVCIVSEVAETMYFFVCKVAEGKLSATDAQKVFALQIKAQRELASLCDELWHKLTQVNSALGASLRSRIQEVFQRQRK
jgi:hypothetical protein